MSPQSFLMIQGAWETGKTPLALLCGKGFQMGKSVCVAHVDGSFLYTQLLEHHKVEKNLHKPKYMETSSLTSEKYDETQRCND